MVHKVCICIKDYIANNGRKYYLDNIYKVISVRTMYDIEYNEVVGQFNMWLGYIPVDVFRLYFVYEEDVLDEVNNLFNSVIDVY